MIWLLCMHAVFKYDSSKHNVFQVNGTDFKNCTQPPPPNGPLTSGHDWVSLNSSGKYWFICGIDDHCANKGMRLVITVEDSPSPAPSPMSGAPSPSTDSATRGFSEYGYVVSMAAVAAAALLLAWSGLELNWWHPFQHFQFVSGKNKDYVVPKNLSCVWPIYI